MGGQGKKKKRGQAPRGRAGLGTEVYGEDSEGDNGELHDAQQQRVSSSRGKESRDWDLRLPPSGSKPCLLFIVSVGTLEDGNLGSLQGTFLIMVLVVLCELHKLEDLWVTTRVQAICKNGLVGYLIRTWVPQ